jgi:hypothetical protein
MSSLCSDALGKRANMPDWQQTCWQCSMHTSLRPTWLALACPPRRCFAAFCL